MWTRGRTMRGPVLATVVAAVFAWGCAPQPVQVPSAPAALPHSFEPPPAAAERPEMRTRPSAGVEAPDAFPEQVYRRAAAQGAPIFRVDSATSTVVVEVLDVSPTHGVVWCDGRRSVELRTGMEIEVTRGRQRLRLARLSQAPFTDRLVQKFGLRVEGWRGSADPAITVIDTPA